MVHQIKSEIRGAGRRIAIAVGRFNELIGNRLLDGAIDALLRHGTDADSISVVWVPGAFELPLTCRWLAESGRHDGVIALGTVIRGATTHYDYVCQQAARGVLDAGVNSGVPVAFGVLTTENTDQALERAGGKAGNKGADAALTVLEMIGLRQQLTADGR